ncbi:MAG: flagellar protein FlaG [Sinimarinibacterium sp.]|jgi:flagellar protein FlaG
MTEAINSMSTMAPPNGGGRFDVSVPMAARQSTDPGAASKQLTADADAETTKPTVTVRDVEAAAQELQDYVRKSNSDLAFRVDKELGRVIVSIVDRKDGTVLRQIPGEEVLRIARAIAKLQDGSGGLMQEVA